MLWLCLHFPDLALEVFSRAQIIEVPFVVIDGRGRNQHVLRANTAAQHFGIQPGMPLGAAHGLAHTLRTRLRDHAAERAALNTLAAWAGQFTSVVSLVPPQALLLEVQGSLRLFEGLEALWQRIAQGIAELGYRAQLALAPTPLAATWLACAGVAARVTELRHVRSALATLPLPVLDLSAAQQAFFEALGLRTVGECLRLPRGGVNRRVGEEWLSICDRALGRVADPRRTFEAPQRFTSRIQFPAPIDSVEALLFPARRLLLELQGALRARNASVQEVLLQLHHADAISKVRLTLVRPKRDAQHLLTLFRERFERLVLPSPVEDLTLRSAHMQPSVEHNLDLFCGDAAPQEQSAMLLERLQARLGRDAVRDLRCVAEHRPEYASRNAEPVMRDETAHASIRGLSPSTQHERKSDDPVILSSVHSTRIEGSSVHSTRIEGAGDLPANPSGSKRDRIETPTEDDSNVGADRPLWLLPQPVPLDMRDGRPCFDGVLHLQPDRERVHSGWWDGAEVMRDYFIATNDEGVRLWVFRELSARRRWMVQGVFA